MQLLIRTNDEALPVVFPCSTSITASPSDRQDIGPFGSCYDHNPLGYGSPITLYFATGPPRVPSSRIVPPVPPNGETIDYRTTDENTLGPETECLDDVHTGTDARIEEDGHFIPNGIHYLWKDVEGADGAVDLSTCGKRRMRISICSQMVREIQDDLPPWFETMMPSQPESSASFASSTC